MGDTFLLLRRPGILRNHCALAVLAKGLGSRYRSAMNSPRFWVLLLMGVLLGLTPLAHASPPDQTWIGGFYDDADYDDVVLLITGAPCAVESDLLPPMTPVAFVAGYVPPISSQAPPEPSR